MTARPIEVPCRAMPPLARLLRMLTLALLVGLLPAFAGVAAQEAPPPADAGQERSAKEPPEQKLKRAARDLRQSAERTVSGFTAYANDRMERLTSSRPLGWGLLFVASLVGLISLMYGWTLIQALLIPFAPVWGLLTGGVTAFAIIEAFYTDWEVWFRVVLLTVGVALGLALYLFSALRAKPVAAFLVVLSPFLILAVLFFPQTQVVGLVLFCAGFLAGFAAMVEVRPLAIFSTSLFGAGCFVAAWGLLAHLLGERAQFIPDSFSWTIGQPMMLLLIWAVIAFVGVNYQFATGPKGTLAD